MKVKTLVLDLVVVALGAAAGFALGGRASVPADAPEQVQKARGASDKGADASERALSARIRELEALYKAAPEPKKTVVEADEEYWAPIVTTNADGNCEVLVNLSGPSKFDMRAFYEKMRKEDPKKFEERTAFMKKNADGIAEGYDETIRFFSQLDDTWIDESDRAQFNAFIGNLKTASDSWRRQGRWDLPLAVRNAVEDSGDRVRANIDSMRPKIRAMFMKRTAEVMGLDAAAADDFISTVGVIEGMTSRYRPVSLPPNRK